MCFAAFNLNQEQQVQSSQAACINHWALSGLILPEAKHLYIKTIRYAREPLTETLKDISLSHYIILVCALTAANEASFAFL